MKTKIKKIIAAIFGIVLTLLLLLFVNAWMGNPVSKLLAKNAATLYINQNYSQLDLEVQKVHYNFKFGSYIAFCQSKTSIDTAFSIYVDSFGNVQKDDYEYEVANNFTTLRRLDSQLRTMGDAILRKHLKYEITNALFMLADLSPQQLMMLQKDMPLNIDDPVFDIRASITIIDPDVSYEKMAQVLTDMAQACQQENIPITTYDVRIEYNDLVSVEGKNEARENKHITIYDIPSAILQEKDLPKALENLDAN